MTMHPDRSYFFVHYDGAIQIIKPEGDRNEVLVPRRLESGDFEILRFVRHALAGPKRVRHYFYADARLTAGQAISNLLNPPHRAPPLAGLLSVDASLQPR